MTLIKPPALNKGDTIGIIAPSSYIESDKLDAGVAVLRDYGFKIFIHPQTLARDNQSAGTPAEKAAALHEVFTSPDVKAVIAAGGGNRSLHALSGIDFAVLKNNPKIYMGFSDSTALLQALASKAGLTSIHGPVIKTLPKHDASMLDHAFSLLAGKAGAYPLNGSTPLQEGQAEGPLFGGNLSTLCAMIGTGYLPDLSGAILLLEDTHEELSRIDRMLWQLRHAVPFRQLAGLVFGQFTNSLDSGRPFGFTLEDILREHTADMSGPVIMNAPFGHGDQLYALPIGVQARLSVSGGEPHLTLAEPPVAT